MFFFPIASTYAGSINPVFKNALAMELTDWSTVPVKSIAVVVPGVVPVVKAVLDFGAAGTFLEETGAPVVRVVTAGLVAATVLATVLAVVEVFAAEADAINTAMSALGMFAGTAALMAIAEDKSAAGIAL